MFLVDALGSLQVVLNLAVIVVLSALAGSCVLTDEASAVASRISSLVLRPYTRSLHSLDSVALFPENII